MSGAPIVACEEVREAERRAVAAGATFGDLMERAGEACARLTHDYWPTGRVSVLVGPGNNGGDAFVCARRLVERGHEVTLYELAPDKPRSPEGQAASDAWIQPRLHIHTKL